MRESWKSVVWWKYSEGAEKGKGVEGEGEGVVIFLMPSSKRCDISYLHDNLSCLCQHASRIYWCGNQGGNGKTCVCNAASTYIVQTLSYKRYTPPTAVQQQPSKSAPAVAREATL